MSVDVTKLPSGLTVVTDTMPHLETAALGVWAIAVRIGIEPSSSAAAPAVAPLLRRPVVREAQGSGSLIRSK